MFDGVAGTAFTVVNDTTISVTTRLGDLGPADVVVIEAGGNGSLPAGFTYTAPAGGAAVPTAINPNTIRARCATRASTVFERNRRSSSLRSAR